MSTLPPGFGVRLREQVKVYDGGRTLVGGSGRVLYLAPAAAEVVASMPRAVGEDPTTQQVARRLLDSGLGEPWWPDGADLGHGDDATVREVTVVVPVRDRPDGLREVLAALPVGLAVVVVDDGSLDPGPVADVAAEQGARLVVHATNAGPAAARNTGLRHVSTAYVAFVDSDVVPQPGWLALLRRHFDDPYLALVAPRVLGPAARASDSWVERYEQARSSLDLGTSPAAVRIHGQVSYLPSACLLARTAALGAGFDEELLAGEDVDLVWRLLGEGWRVRYEPRAVVRHRHRSQPGEWLRRKAFYGFSAAPLAARHADAVSPMVLSAWSAVMLAALRAQRRWSVPVAGAAAGVATVRTARRLRRSERPVAAAGRLVLEGAVASLRQAAAALTRHYWPLTLVACVFSRRARRAAVVVAVVDGVLDHRRVHPRLDPVRYVSARRLDDIAYGTGVWLGAVRARSVRALLPRWVR